MKNLHFILVLTIIFAASCKNSSDQPSEVQNDLPEAQIELSNTVTMEIKIEGMTCTGCEQTVENAVKAIAGVESVDASHTKANAIIQIDPTKLDTTLVSSIINETGYKTIAFVSSETK